MTDAEWDPQEPDAACMRSLSEQSPKGGILVLDETGFPKKKGNRSVGVAHQYCEELDKVANRQYRGGNKIKRLRG